MERFIYLRAVDVQHAAALLREPGIRSRVLAGGTDLVLMARGDRNMCDRVVDISLIPELHRISREADTVTIGAAASFSEVIESPIVNETAPVLVQACRQVGAVQIRNMGTLGGNVANAAACADSLPTLVCLDAVARILTPSEVRTLAVSELVIRPNRTQIPADGLLVSLSYTVPAAGSRSLFLKLGRRNALAISRLTLAALGRLDAAGHVAEARLVPGSATPQIRRFAAVEEWLVGHTPDETRLQEAGRLAVEEMARLTGKRWSSEFKEPAMKTLVVRALRTIFTPLASTGANA